MTTTLDLTSFKALSFDCYGTLIDWEAGIGAVLSGWAAEQGLSLTTEELLLAYADNEAAVERETPTALYPDVLAEAFRRTGNVLGKPVSDPWAARLGGSVPDWPAFPDSAEALARLAQHYELIILSNVHRAGFAGSNQWLHGDFAAIITAEDVAGPAERLGEDIWVQRGRGFPLDRGLVVGVGKQQLLGGQAQAMLSCPPTEDCTDARLPVDQRPVAVEAQRLEARQVKGGGHRRSFRSLGGPEDEGSDVGAGDAGLGRVVRPIPMIRWNSFP